MRVPAVFVACLCSMIIFGALFLREAGAPPLDFFSVQGWMGIVTDPYLVMGITTHFMLVDLLMGLWMTHRFYSRWSASCTLVGRVHFSAILLLSFMNAPAGFVIYLWFEWLFFSGERVLTRRRRERVPESAQPLLDTRKMRFGEDLPTPLRRIYHLVTGAVGLSLLRAWVVGYALFVALAFALYLKDGRHLNKPSRWKPKGSPAFLRIATAQIRLKMIAVAPEDRGGWWTLRHRFLQIGCFVEVGANAKDPVALSGALQDSFGA